MKVGITGANGLIGWHLRTWLFTHRPDIEVRLATRETFNDQGKLQHFVSDLDFIVHCAGANRGEDPIVEATNIELANQLSNACEAMAQKGKRYPQIVFTNSTHVDRDTAYGRGKREAAHLLKNSAEMFGSGFANLILPHVFGEFGRPFYNSVVSTFCHQLAIGEKPEILVDGDLELIHAQVVAERCVDAIEKLDNGVRRIDGNHLKVSVLYNKLEYFSRSYFDQIIPDLIDSFDIELFNTFRSYLFPKYYPRTLTLHSDNRGSLFELIKSQRGGQAFLSTTIPGITRGNHYHTRKVERFLVVAGDAEIRLRKLFS